MVRTLVVPLDGSQLAEKALPYAVRLARAGQGRLVLVRATIAHNAARIDAVDSVNSRLDAVGEVEQYLAGVADSIATQVEVETAVAYGPAASQILEQLRRVNADGVVMATHGRTGLPHLLVGSVAESVLAASDVPVFLVHARPGAEPRAPFDPMVARLMVPLDGSTFAEAALEPAIQFLGPAGELVLVCITGLPEHVLMDANRRQVVAYLDQLLEAQTREANEYLDGVARRLRVTYPGMRLSFYTQVADDAGTGIVQAAAERAADLVVMATHGRTGVQRAVVGSVAGNVLRTGTTPLLLVGPGAQHSQSVPTGGTHEIARH